ncbi:MAG: magnesium/cobalt transporter CorA [Candidatus Eisenbacteria bacterium]|nr:magnesium/cobalt transporter CorA [Candidatus Eisenbacteria bacterium]
MARVPLRKKRGTKQAGLPPGTLVYTGEQRVEKVRIDVIDYDGQRIQEIEAKSVDECLPFKDTPTVTWMNVTGLHDIAVVETLGNRYGIHPLVLEDIVHTGQRPKFDDFGDYLFLVLNTLHRNEDTGEIQTEQISLILGANYVISFQEVPEDPFENVRDRLRQDKGRIRKSGPDYLAYALMDAIVDHYFAILEALGDRIEDMGVEAVNDPTPNTLHDIQGLKRTLNHLRRTIWPLREVISALERGESKLVAKATGVYLRDVYDHTIQVVEMVETFRDMASGMFDTYLSSVSNRMNEVMKVLTIIATIFIPVTFVAGVYGMNFSHMPELAWPWAYPAVLLLMLAIGLWMVFYFKRKGWL